MKNIRSLLKYKNQTVAVLLLAIIVGLVFLRLFFNGLPIIIGKENTGNNFDVNRALLHVKALSQEPRPIGTKAGSAARDYIISELQSLAVETLTQDTYTAFSWFTGYHTTGMVRNVMARFAGTRGQDALLIVSHYDSVEAGPGAGDSAAAVAGMLETIRLLKNMDAPANDIIFLFADGEESGLLGANAFAEESPLMSKVRLVVNFDARGATGPSQLFETGPENGRLIAEYLKADSASLGTSLANAVYMLLPNNTDFTIFKNRAMPGLNFAFIGNLLAYHTRLDDPAHLDPRTLYHQGLHIYHCAKHFGNIDLNNLAAEDAVYFPLIGNSIVHYSLSTATVISIFTIIIFIVIVIYGIRSAQLSLLKILAAAGLLAAFAVVSGGLTWVIYSLVEAVHPQYRTLVELYNAQFYRIALCMLPVLLALLLQRLTTRFISPLHMLAGACLVFIIGSIAFLFVLPGASYIFQWPLFFAAVLLTVNLVQKKLRLPRLVMVGISLLLCIPALFITVDTFTAAFVGLTIHFAWALCGLLALFIGILWPVLDLISAAGRRLLPVLAAAAFVFFLTAGSLTAGFDAAHPCPETVAYGFDADKNRASWFTCAGNTGTWSRQFFKADAASAPLPAFFPMLKGCLFNGSSGFFQASAPVLGINAPELVLLSDMKNAQQNERDIRLLFRSKRAAPQAVLYIQRQKALKNVSIAGKKIVDVPLEKLKLMYRLLSNKFDYKNWIVIRCAALPGEGAEVSLTCSLDEPLLLKAVDITFGLPDLTALGYAERPPESMPGYDILVKDGIIAVKEYKF
jgi:hypothetical protein